MSHMTEIKTSQDLSECLALPPPNRSILLSHTRLTAGFCFLQAKYNLFFLKKASITVKAVEVKAG